MFLAIIKLFRTAVTASENTIPSARNNSITFAQNNSGKLVSLYQNEAKITNEIYFELPPTSAIYKSL